MVRERQAGNEGAEEEIAVAPVGPPHQRPVEEGRHEEEMEPVHLGERGLEPELAADRECQAGRDREDRARAEPDRDQDRRTAGRGRRDRREQLGPEAERSDRDQAEELSEQDV